LVSAPEANICRAAFKPCYRFQLAPLYNGKTQNTEQKQNNGEKFGSHPEQDNSGRTQALTLKEVRAG
jgi:hypothetical protein